MRELAFVAVFVFVGCQGPQGPKGDPGPTGIPGPQGVGGPQGESPDGGQPPRAVSCSPGEMFCIGDRPAQCTLSGTDAIIWSQGCGAAYPSASNPASCGANPDCPGGQAACCVRAKSPATVALTSPSLSASQTKAIGGAPGDFSIAQPPETGPFLTTITTSGVSISVQIGYEFRHVGAAIRPGLDGASVILSAPGWHCADWTGTMRLDSDVPSWRVSLDLTCDDYDLRDVRLAGTISGEL